MLGSLAVQFGYATAGAARCATPSGRVDERGVWTRFRPDPADLQKRLAPHARGAILVAAVFDAFIAIYKTRTADLLRIYTGGTGVLPTGAIHPDLVRRLADEAAKSAATSSTCASVRSTTCRPLTSRSASTCAASSPRTSIWSATTATTTASLSSKPSAAAGSTRATSTRSRVDTLRWQGFNHSEFPSNVRARISEQYQGIIEELKQYADKCL